MELAFPEGIVSTKARNTGFRIRAVGVVSRDVELLNWGQIEEVGVDRLAPLGFARIDGFNLLLVLLLGDMLARLGFTRIDGFNLLLGLLLGDLLAQLGFSRLGSFNSLAGLSVLGLLLLLLHGSLKLFSRRGLRAALLRLRPIELVQVRIAKPVRHLLLLLLRVLPLRWLGLSLLMLLLHSLRLKLD